MAARLKTFITSDGFTDYIVAATSRPKALAAWGVKQDLFKEGRAREVDDPALVKIAEKSPGEVVSRRAPGMPKVRAAQAARKKAEPSAADRRRVADLEAKLEALEARRAEGEAALAAERQVLEAKAERAALRFEKERQALAAKLAAARSRLD